MGATFRRRHRDRLLLARSASAGFFFYGHGAHRDLHSFPTRRSSDLFQQEPTICTSVLSTRTERIKLITAVHTGLWHPAMIAKQGATLDVFSKGRYAVNILSGWFKGE